MTDDILKTESYQIEQELVTAPLAYIVFNSDLAFVVANNRARFSRD